MGAYLRAATILWVSSLGSVGPLRAATLNDDGPVYLAYAGPYSSSPSSAFGHLFLVIPDYAGQPAPLWDVVTFSAETFGADPLRYMTIGIAGGFLGRFSRLDFHEKTREYEVLDDRDLWLVQLALTPAQREDLDRELAELEGRWFPYTFFEKNCAYYLQALLSRATGQLPLPTGMVSPLDVVATTLESGLSGTSHYRPAASRRLRAMAAGVQPEVTRRLKDTPWVTVLSDTVWIHGLPPLERRFLHQFAWLRATSEHRALPPAAQAGLALLRRLNGQPSTNDGETLSVTGAGDPILPPAFHRYSRMRVGFVEHPRGRRISARYRGALHDEVDPWSGHRPLNSMEFLSLEVSAPTDHLALQVDEIVLFSQRALSPSDWIAGRTSWLFEAQARRGGIFDSEAIHMETRAGLGKTTERGSSWYTYWLVTAAVVAVWDDDVAFAPGLELGTAVAVGPDWRLGARWTREHHVGQWELVHQRIHGWIRRDLGSRLGIVGRGESGPGGELFSISIDWYP